MQLWRLPELSATTDSSAALVGSVTALQPMRHLDGQPLGSLAWIESPGAGPLLVAGSTDNSQLALYSLDGEQLQLQQVGP